MVAVHLNAATATALHMPQYWKSLALQLQRALDLCQAQLVHARQHFLGNMSVMQEKLERAKQSAKKHKKARTEALLQLAQVKRDWERQVDMANNMLAVKEEQHAREIAKIRAAHARELDALRADRTDRGVVSNNKKRKTKSKSGAKAS